MNRTSIIAGMILIAIVSIGVGFYASRVFAAMTAGNLPSCSAECGESPAEHPAHDDSDADHAHTLTLTEPMLRQFGVETATSGPGSFSIRIALPAEIALDEDRKAHVLPRVPGVVRAVHKNLGDFVRAGEVLAVLHSRELADYKAAYLAAREKKTLADAMFDREKILWEKKITAEQDFLKSRRETAEAGIELRSAEQKLHALGFSEDYLKALPTLPEESYIVYEMVAPIDGTIVEKHMTLGELLKDDSQPFVIADLRQVWVNIHISLQDMPKIKPGQEAVVKTDHLEGHGVVRYISPIVDSATRTVLARIVLDNDSGQWRPGTFATASLAVDQVDCPIVIPREAIVRVENQSMIFVPVENGFQAQTIQVGRSNEDFAEIVSGLEAGWPYVAKGAFTLKSELLKSAEDPCGGH